MRAGEATANTLSFYISSTDAAGVAYTVVEQGDPLPEHGAALFESGISGDASGERRYTLSDLSPETTYIVAAAARSGTVYSAVKQITMTTLKGGQVTITLTAGEATVATLSFTLKTSANAERAAYSCIEKGAPIPDAETVLSDGVAVDPGERSCAVENLDPETAYVVVAVASAGTVHSAVETLEMTTAADYDRKVECTDSKGAYYGNTLTGEAGTGLFYLNLGTITWDEQGQATGAGVVYRLALHSAAATDPGHAVPASGTYTFDPNDTYAAGTIDRSHSSWAICDEEGYQTDEGTFTFGTLVLQVTGDYYDIEALLTDDAGRKSKVLWSGTMQWADMVNNKRFTAKAAAVIYYGKGDYNPNSDHWYIELTDKPGSGSFIMHIDCYTAYAADPQNPSLDEGIYTPDTDGSATAGTFKPGESVFGKRDDGTYLVSATGSSYCTGGSMTVTREGDSYTFDCRFVTDGGYTVEGKFTGELDITNLNGSEQGFVIAADRIFGDKGTYYGEYDPGVYNYYVKFADTEFSGGGYFPHPINGGPANIVTLDFYSPTPADGEAVLPEGTYIFDKESGANTCGTVRSSVWHFDHDAIRSTVMFVSGTVSVAHVSEGVEITLEADSDGHGTILFQYQGEVPFNDYSSMAPRPRYFSQAPYAAEEEPTALAPSGTLTYSSARTVREKVSFRL